MKSLADGQETVVAVPVALDPVQVQVTPVAVLVEVRHVAVAVRIHADRAVEIRGTPSETLPLVRYPSAKGGGLRAVYIAGAISPLTFAPSSFILEMPMAR